MLRAVIGDHLRRAVLAFPDEDVLVGTRFNDAGGFEAFKVAVATSCPAPATRPRARSGPGAAGWPSASASRRRATTTRPSSSPGDGTHPLVFDHESLKPEKIDAEVAAQFDHLDLDRGDCLVAFGWVMAEDLLKHG